CHLGPPGVTPGVRHPGETANKLARPPRRVPDTSPHDQELPPGVRHPGETAYNLPGLPAGCLTPPPHGQELPRCQTPWADSLQTCPAPSQGVCHPTAGPTAQAPASSRTIVHRRRVGRLAAGVAEVLRVDARRYTDLGAGAVGIGGLIVQGAVGVLAPHALVLPGAAFIRAVLRRGTSSVFHGAL